MLKLEKVTGGYANIPVLKDVTFEVADGELVGARSGPGGGPKSAHHHRHDHQQQPTQRVRDPA